MVSVVIVAAGSGLRMKSSIRKQYLELDGKSIVSRTLMRFDSCPFIDSIVLVVPQDDLEHCASLVYSETKCARPLLIVPGGKERHESVRLGLEAVPHKDGIVLIHDGVRPFVTDDIIEACINGARENGACIPAVPVADTVKYSDDGCVAVRTVPRNSLWLAQTPQAFDFGLIYGAHIAAAEKGIVFTDDASLLEELGHPSSMITGSRLNIKITSPEDLIIANAILSQAF